MKTISTRIIGLVMVGLISVSTGSAWAGQDADPYQDGRKLAFDKTTGNCLACHQIAGGDSAGNIGPPLLAMKVRYPDRAVLRQRIWNAPQFNPETPMPPFGKHRILTEEQIDLVVDFIWSL